MTTINKRIKMLLAELDVTQTDYGIQVGLTRSTVSKIVRGESNPTKAMLDKTLQIYPHVNPVWLFVGDGEMFKESDTGNVQVTDSVTHNKRGGEMTEFEKIILDRLDKMLNIIAQQQDLLSKHTAADNNAVSLFNNKEVTLSVAHGGKAA